MTLELLCFLLVEKNFEFIPYGLTMPIKGYDIDIMVLFSCFVMSLCVTRLADLKA